MDEMNVDKINNNSSAVMETAEGRFKRKTVGKKEIYLESALTIANCLHLQVSLLRYKNDFYHQRPL